MTLASFLLFTGLVAVATYFLTRNDDHKMNGIYFIPIFAVVLIGMRTRRVPPIAAKLGLVVGIVTVACGYFVPPLALIVASMHDFQFLGVVFAWLIILMLGIGEVMPLKEEWTQQDKPGQLYNIVDCNFRHRIQRWSIDG